MARPSVNTPFFRPPRLYAQPLNGATDYRHYEDIEIKWSSTDKYSVLSKIGRGKYSEVYLAIDNKNNHVVLKVLKPVRKRKIQRETSILNHLRGGPNIVELLQTVHDRHTTTAALVFEFVDCVDFRLFFPVMKIWDIKYYMFQILMALDHAHSRGVMHRDLKPHNFVIDLNAQSLKLIDWGLAEYYTEGVAYTVRVASRYYKSPELLVEYEYYHYSLDSWSLGCVLAGIVTGCDPFFKGDNNEDQLTKICGILGVADLRAYLMEFQHELSSPVAQAIKGPRERREWNTFLTTSNELRLTPDVQNLLDSLLVYNHHERILPLHAMAHEYFNDVRALIIEQHKK